MDDNERRERYAAALRTCKHFGDDTPSELADAAMAVADEELEQARIAWYENASSLASDLVDAKAAIARVRAEVLRGAAGVAAEEGSSLYDNSWHKASQGAYHVADRLARMAEEGTK